MFRLKKTLNYGAISNFFRNYVSFIDINFDSMKAVKIKPEFDTNDSNDDEIKVEVLDGEKNLIKLSSVAKLSQTDKKFTLEAKEMESTEDLTFILELPIHIFKDVEINASAVKGDFKFDNLPKVKRISANTNDGKIKIQHTRCEEVRVKGSDILLDTLFAYDVQLRAMTNLETSLINIVKCQCDKIMAEAPKIRTDSCYTNDVYIKSYYEALLKNLHGNFKFDCSGYIFNTVGFSGTFNGKISTERTMLHFAELSGDSDVKISHPSGLIRAGFANEIVKNSTNLHIKANCPVHTKSKEFIVCQKSENSFEVIKVNENSDSTLKMVIEEGKELQLIKQSWIDSITFDF